MAFVFPSDACTAHIGPVEALQPPALIQSVSGVMSGAATITLLANLDHLAGFPLRLPPFPELQVQRLHLPPGERVPVPEQLALRHVMVERGSLSVEHRGVGRAQTLGAGQWALDDGRHTWSASESAPVDLLVVQHVRRHAEGAGRLDLRATAGVARAHGGAPGGPGVPVARAGCSAPGGPPSPGEAAAQPASPEAQRFTSDYTGQPITMPDGPLRVLINRYVIQGSAALPWHLHPHQRYAYVEGGRLQVEDDRGHRRVCGPGDVLVEQQQVVHRGINLGLEPVFLLVFDYIPKHADANTVLHTAP